MDSIVSFGILAFVAIIVFFTFRIMQFKSLSAKKSTTHISSSIEQLRSIGELSVFQVYSKEIITKTDHALGGFGKDYLRWLIGEKKLSMIFEFEINFVYDLRSQSLVINDLGNGRYNVKMPPCNYKFSIADMKFYDEKDGKFMPLLLPDLLNSFFVSSFGEEDKNKVIAEARNEVQKMSERLILQLQSKIHKSACDTLEAIAKSFGANEIVFEFNDDSKSFANELANKVA